MSLTLWTSAVAAAVFATSAAAMDGVELVKVITPHRTVLRAGESGFIVVDAIIRPGYHVQANPPAFPNLIPLTLSLDPAPGLEIGTPVYPPPRRLRLEGSGETLFVLDGRFSIRVPVKRSGAAPATIQIRGTLRYQGCDDVRCLFPRSVQVTLPVDVAHR
jgi:DsbC/DsbD-like thiol-disulfide interchange protein